MVQTINDSADIELKKPGLKPNYSRFPIGAPNAYTTRYGEYAIDAVKDTVVGDDISFFLPSETKSPGLKAPMMQRPNEKLDSFWVPLMAIIPNSHDYLVANPLKGDDLPTYANTVIEEFENKIKKLIDNEITAINEGINNETLATVTTIENVTDRGLMKRIFNLINFIDMMYSPGNLLTAIGRPMHRMFNWTRSVGNEELHNVGGWFDDTVRKIKNAIDDGFFYTQVNEETIQVNTTRNNRPGNLDLRTFIYMMKDDPSMIVQLAGKFDGSELLKWVTEEGESFWELNIEMYIENKQFTEGAPNHFNYNRAIAYQLICAHFYSNDKIDYIYSAELWRQNLGSLIDSIYGNATYDYNGINIYYDWTSGYYMNQILTGQDLSYPEVQEYMRLIFGWNRSLRFVDYFTGARSEPLAVGNSDVAVNEGKVSIIDVTQRIQEQRYRNAVNKVGQRWEAQQEELFGVKPKPDYHNPFWISHTKSTIGESETENTGDEQYATTAGSNKLVAVTGQFTSANRFAFTCYSDRDGIAMAIRYYDTPRLYTEGIDPFTKKATRFDMFNPYMQYIGDQEIYADELIASLPSDEVFGYTGRDMEYKVGIGKARGGFIFNLPGYAFIADKKRPYGWGQVTPHIGPSYIRSIETEIDEFYQSLVGYSLDSYFHFIVMSHAVINAKRPMTYNPQILG